MVVPVTAFEAMLAVKSKQQVVAAELVRRLQRDEAEGRVMDPQNENRAPECDDPGAPDRR